MPKMPNFFGGFDVQSSSNVSANKLINLIPITNNDGTVVAFQNAPGLRQKLANAGSAISSGIYTASNGRCFQVAGTTLYEITISGGVLSNTSRGTVTAGTVTRFSDNGIELIFVNGTDGWVLTFATNTLTKLVVKQYAVTISVATPAVITKTAHGLIAGTPFRLSSTGTLPTGFSDSTTYYVLATGLTADAFQASLTAGGAAINTSGAGSGTHTLTTLSYGFPEGCKTIDYINGAFVACEPDTQNFNRSEPLNAFFWDVTKVQTSDSNPDNVTGQAVSHNELIVFNKTSAEVHYDNNGEFVRNTSGILEVGCDAPYSIVRLDNTIFWLGNTDAGNGIVWKLNGYTPTRISSYAVEFALQQMDDLTDSIAFAYQQDGHHYYVLTLPSGGKTFVHDVNTGLWHERANFAGGAFYRWEAQEYAFFAGLHLVCDYSEGHIYSIDPTHYQYGSGPIKWMRSWLAPSSDMKRVRHSKLQLDIEAGTGLIDGTDAQAMLRFSDDGGHTWSNELWRSMGEIGEYAKRVIWNRLGITKGQPRVYEVSGNASTKTVLIGAYLE